MMSDQLTHFTGGVHDELTRQPLSANGLVMAEAAFSWGARIPEALVTPRREEALCYRRAIAKMGRLSAWHDFAGLLQYRRTSHG